MYTVKEVSEILKVSPHTIRYYTNCNLTPKLNRDKKGVRLFDEVDIEYLKVTIYLRNCDMPIQSIREFLSLSEKGDSTIFKRYTMLLEQQKKLNEKLEQLLQSKEYISYKLNLYAKYMSGSKNENNDEPTV